MNEQFALLSEEHQVAEEYINQLGELRSFYREERDYFRTIVASEPHNLHLLQRRRPSPTFVNRGLRIESPTPISPAGRLQEMMRRQDESSMLEEREVVMAAD